MQFIQFDPIQHFNKQLKKPLISIINIGRNVIFQIILNNFFKKIKYKYIKHPANLD